MSTRQILLDLFCGAGGAARGYQRAGFYVVGVDVRPQPHYAGDEFYQDDALRVLAILLAGEEWRGYRLRDFAAIHASTPCQGYSRTRQLWKIDHVRLIEDVRSLLEETQRPYIMENVADAWRHMPAAVLLCGTALGLRVRRHRLFESSHLLYAPGACQHHPADINVYGHAVWCYEPNPNSRHTGGHTPGRPRPHSRTIADARAAFDIDWMTQAEMAQTIPPAYTEWLGRQLMAYVREGRAA